MCIQTRLYHQCGCLQSTCTEPCFQSIAANANNRRHKLMQANEILGTDCPHGRCKSNPMKAGTTTFEVVFTKSDAVPEAEGAKEMNAQQP